MSSKCFVPSCENTVGIPFPEQNEIRDVWLKSLQISNLEPDENSFICLDHFEAGDLVEEQDTDADPEGSIDNRIKEGAVPRVDILKTAFDQSGAADIETIESIKQELTAEQYLEENGEESIPVPEDVASEKSLLEDEEHLIEEQQQESTDVPSLDDNMIEEATYCRLCMSINVDVNILKSFQDVPIIDVIKLCIQPLEISEDDHLSKYICKVCLASLYKFHEFRNTCIKMDKVQRNEVHEQPPTGKRRIELDPNLENLKRLKEQMNSEPKTYSSLTPRFNVRHMEQSVLVKSKPRTTVDDLEYLLSSDDGIFKKSEDKFVTKVTPKVKSDLNIPLFKITKENYMKSNIGVDKKLLSIYNVRETISKSPPLLVPLKKTPLQGRKHKLEIISDPPKTGTSPKYDKLEEELRMMLEGTMSKDDMSVDHVIVRVVSDDESEMKPTKQVLSAKRKKLKIPPLKIRKEHNVVKIGVGTSQVVIPKGIRVSVPENFESCKGMFPSTVKMGAFNTEFAYVDRYLFEYRLCKGNERFLRCVTLHCPSLGTQKVLDGGMFDDRVCIKIAHNHPQPTDNEMKKEMFYYVMKRKMQSDKGVNFRAVYDTVCLKDPIIKDLVPLRNVINEICRHQLTYKLPTIQSFDEFYDGIEDDVFQKLQFTNCGKQFYQERFTVEDEDTKAIIFANKETITKVAHSKLMYVDASFRIDTHENFSYQLVSVLVWMDDSYYPIMFALVNKRTLEIFKKVFSYLHDTLAPELCPEEIVTDYESNIYYALGETYLDSHIGGSVFYYTQNLYKKICSLKLSRDLETNSYFRSVYHMLLMLPLLPVNTIMDGLYNIEVQAKELGVFDCTKEIFEHVKDQWIQKVTPDLFCVHRLENRINENIIAPFKKLRDFLMLSKGKMQKQSLTIVNVVEKLIELEGFLQTTYSSENKKSFGRDLSSSQKKNVLRAWLFIETHPKININNFFMKVLGYIKCMENQLWIWGYYKYSGDVTDELINASNFSIVSTDETGMEIQTALEEDEDEIEEKHQIHEEDDEEGETFLEEGQQEEEYVYGEDTENTVVMEGVLGPSGEFVIQSDMDEEHEAQFDFVPSVCL